MRTPMQLLFQRLLVYQFFVRVACATPLATDEHGDYNGSDLIEWIRSSPEGEVHPSLRIGRERPGDPTSILGLFVSSSPGTKLIEEGDVIARIPWSHLIGPDRKYRQNLYGLSCRSIYRLAKELELGESSMQAPYVRYLQSLPRGIMPGEWTKGGQAFLSEVLGHGELPPYEESWRGVYEREFVKACMGNDNDAERAAFWLSRSRDEDSLMVPLYDMANHSNDPALLNTVSQKPEEEGEAFLFLASRTIVPGEQIYNCYNRCNQCSDTDPEECSSYSFHRTPDLLSIFGFVEDYPQNWALDPGDDSKDPSTMLEFCLEREADTGKLVVYWEDEDDMPDETDGKWIMQNLRRLQRLVNEKDKLEQELVLDKDGGGKADDSKMTRWEWESIWRYHRALVQALNMAYQSIETDWQDEL